MASEIEVNVLDNILSGDKLITVNHLLSLLEKLDKLGIIDVVNGLLEDDEYLGKIMGAIVNDKTMELIGNWNNLVSFMDILTDENTKENIQFAFNMLTQLRKSGIIDPVLGILNDEEYMSKIMGAIVNDKTLELIGRWNNIVDLIDTVTSTETISSIKSTLELLKDLQNTGIIDPIKGLLKDEETLGKIISGLINDFTMNLLTNWDNIIKGLSSMNLENFKYYTEIINKVGEAIKVEKVKPVGLGGLLSALRDPEVQKGLGVMISILKHIGENYKSE